jgi:uncharacterized membrane protein YeaQ/YmgE (transglycosylase-associated protein family)
MRAMANAQTTNPTKSRSRRSRPTAKAPPRSPIRVIIDWDALAALDKQALAAQVGLGLVAGWLASWLVGGSGLLRYALTGMIGSFLGGIFLDRLGLDLGLRSEVARRITTATLGAVLVILAARLLG